MSGTSLYARAAGWLNAEIAKHTTDTELQRRYRTLSIGVAVASVAMAIVGVAFGVFGAASVCALMVGGAALVGLQLGYLRRTGALESAGYRAVSAGTFAVVSSLTLLGGVGNTAFSGIYLVPMAAGLFVDARALRRFAAVAVVTCLVVFGLEWSGRLPESVVPPAYRTAQLLFMRCIVLVVAVGWVQVFMAERDRAERRMSDARDDAEREAASKEALAEAIEVSTADTEAMLASLEQGLCVVLGDGVIGRPYTRHLARMWGEDDLEGRDVGAWLFGCAEVTPDEQQRMTERLRHALAATEAERATRLADLPREVTVEWPARRLQLELDWQAMADDREGRARILLAVRDVTAWRALQAEARAARDRLAIVADLISCEPRVFDDSIDGMRKNLALAEADPTEADAHLEAIADRAKRLGWRAVALGAARAMGAGAPADVEPVARALDAYEGVWTATLARARRAAV